MKSKRIIFAIPVIFFCLIIAQACSSLMHHAPETERGKSGLAEKSIQVADHKIAYLEGGKGEAIILLHGFGDHKGSWVQFAGEITPQYLVIIPDLPGFGDSTKILTGQYDIDTQVARLHGFVDSIGIKKFHIAGNSMGGLISGIYSVTHPDQILSLGLMDTGGIADREPSGLSRELAKGANPLIIETPADFDRLLSFMFVQPPSLPGPIKTYVVEKAIASKNFNKKIFAEATPGNMLELRLKDIKAKTLIIWGDTDRVFPASSAKVIEQGVKGSKMIIIKECGHLPMVEKPEETAMQYLEFIK